MSSTSCWTRSYTLSTTSAPRHDQAHAYNQSRETRLALHPSSRSLQDLRFTIAELLTPLQKLLTAAAHNAVFANLQQIAELHARLEDELQEAKRVPKKEKGEKIASAFIALLPFFKMYATYCANYGDVAHALEQVQQDAASAALLHDVYERSGTTLAALLFRPVQRICLYPLLFKQARPRTCDRYAFCGCDGGYRDTRYGAQAYFGRRVPHLPHPLSSCRLLPRTRLLSTVRLCAGAIVYGGGCRRGAFALRSGLRRGRANVEPDQRERARSRGAATHAAGQLSRLQNQTRTAENL